MVLLWISLITFIFSVVGILVLMRISSESMAQKAKDIVEKQGPIALRAFRIQKNMKPSVFKRLLGNFLAMMAYMGQTSKFSMICLLSAVAAVAGILLALSIGNVWLIVPLCIGCCSLPFIAIRLYSYRYTDRISRELELALSAITTSYLRTNDILRSFEENVDYIEMPVKKVFEEFIAQVRYANPNLRQAIDDMAEKVDNTIYREWCEALKKCANNASLKHMLMPIVNKFSTLRGIVSEIKDEVAGMRMQFLVVAGLAYANIPLIWVMSADWYDVLVSSVQGQACIGVIATITVICLILMIYWTKPIKYKV